MQGWLPEVDFERRPWYLVEGTAPAVVSNTKPVSHVVVVPFTIAP